MSEDRSGQSLRALGSLLRGAPPGPTVDWAALVDVARRHGVAPLLFWRLEEDGGGAKAVPAGARAALRTQFYAAAVRGMVAERQLGQVLRALAAAEVPTVVVKGAAIGAFYPDPALRGYGDLDVLVPRTRLAEAEEALNERGYRCSGPKEWRLDQHYHLPPMVGAEGKVVVEVHWRLDDPERVGRLPMDELWARAEPWSVGGEPTLRLEGVDAVLHLCRHAMVQNLGRLGLKPVCDLAQMVEGWGEAEWEALVRRAVDYGLGRAVYLMLALAEETLGVDAPAEVMGALCPPEGARLPADLAGRFLALEGGQGMNMPATAVRAWSQGGILPGLVYLWRHVFLSRDGMAALYRVPAGSPRIWLTYVRRPVDLLRQYGKAVWRTARGSRAARGAWQRETWLEQWLQEEEGA